MEQTMTGRGLSSRETSILQLAAQGQTDKQIAVELRLSVGTVRTYWSRIRTKMDASTRAQAVGLFVKRQASFANVPKLAIALATICDGLGLPFWEADEDGRLTSLGGRRGERLLAMISGQKPEVGLDWAEPLEPALRSNVRQALAVATSCNPGHARVVRIALPGTRVAGTLVLIPLVEKGRVCGIAFVAD